MRLPALLALVLALLAPAFAAPRTWTDLDGRTVEADFVGSDLTHVTVRRAADGQTFRIELARLREIDRAYVLAQTVANTVQAAASETVLTPQDEYFQVFQSRLKRFRYGQQTVPANYLGVMSIVERPLGTVPYHVRGLSIGPDGSIVLTSGSGTTPHMKLVEWTPPGETSTIVPLLYKKSEKGITKAERAEDEKAGRFWFFGGQVAHDRKGDLLMTLGACCDNGIFRVSPTSSAPFARLNTCVSSSSLQVPSWDSNHAYIARSNSITRFALSAGSAEIEDEVFSIDGFDVYLGNTLLLARDKIIAGFSLPTGEKDKRGVSVSGKFGIYIDRAAGGYYLLCDDYLSPMAVSPDGRRMIRASKGPDGKTIITEFSLRKK